MKTIHVLCLVIGLIADIAIGYFIVTAAMNGNWLPFSTWLLCGISIICTITRKTITGEVIFVKKKKQ